MEESSDKPKDVSPNNTNHGNASKSKQKTRPTKRRRGSNSDSGDELPDNLFETEGKLYASAVKNNLNESSVRKILKKVVADGRVLAMVKLREEEENELNSNGGSLLTRSKTKELWNAPWNVELTPIKHIPVKTRPEVKALIAQDLPEDEDDDEYKPTHEDVPSDDDQTLESCSDLDSQPRTPATPKHPDASSPKVVKDGPFKVPQNISTSKRKLDLEEEEATIARRTRSKLSLSSTSIEHIESTFVPPDDIPMPDVDDLWNEFLNECLNPASTSKHEDDDEADPEYNVAADPDAADEDEELLSNSIIKISKKELNDLVTELYAVMPEAANEDLAEKLVNSVLTDTSQNEITRWEGKQEPPSEEEATDTVSEKLQSEKNSIPANFSFGKTEPRDDNEHNDVGQNNVTEMENKGVKLTKEKIEINNQNGNKIDASANKHDDNVDNGNSDDEHMVIIEIKNEDGTHIETDLPTGITMAATVEEQPVQLAPTGSAPPILRQMINVQSAEPVTQVVVVEMDPLFTVLPEQIQIIQQQLRQHIQLATTNFLQLYVHPIHWKYAPTYKEYVEAFVKMCKSKRNSVADVCNLKPALELITSWESTVAENTPENKEMVKFIEAESERCRQRNMFHCNPTSDFPEQVKRVVANSAVFLYPHLLPPTPYRPEHLKRFSYIVPEDKLIALGLSEFWDYVDNNRKLFKIRPAPPRLKRRPGLSVVINQIVKYMFPWMNPRHLLLHVQHVRKQGHSENAINIFFRTNKVEPVQHKLLPFNPQMTLYEHPEGEIPRTWHRYLAKTSNRFKKCYARTDHIIQPTTGVPVEMGKLVDVPKKNPLSIDFTQKVVDGLPNTNSQDKFDVNVNSKPDHLVATNLFSVVQTSTGMVLVPLVVQGTNVVNSQIGPITTPFEVQSNVNANLTPGATQDKSTIEVLEKPKENLPTPKKVDEDHCECCVMLRKICKGPKLITDYFISKKPLKKECPCRDRKYPKVSNRLKLLIRLYESRSSTMLKELEGRLNNVDRDNQNNCDADDLEFAIMFQMKFLTRLSVKLSHMTFKKRLYTLFKDFNVDTDDPVKLAEKLHKDLKNDLYEIYVEFLGFLTAEQAENVGVFNHYLVTYMNFILKRIDREVSDIERRKSILTQLKQWSNNSKILTTCQICKNLLMELKNYPRLAQYVFSLFPHKICAPRVVTPQTISINVENPILPEDPASLRDELVPPLDEPEPTLDEPATPPHEPIPPPGDPKPPHNEPTPLPNEPNRLPDESESSLDKPTPPSDEPASPPDQPNPQPDEPVSLTDKSAPTANKSAPTSNKSAPTPNKSTPTGDKLAPPANEIAPSPDQPIPTNHNVETTLSSNEENSEPEPVIKSVNECQMELEIVKEEPTSASEEECSVELTAPNTESPDDSCETSESPMVIAEDETHADKQEWSRNDDKVLLEVIKKYLATKEAQNKSIFKTLQENKVYELISERLTEKSMDNIVQRVLYLLEVLVVKS